MKIIFLDIDGVLTLPIIGNFYKNPHSLCLNNLNYIIKETDAKIVLSSTWRLYNPNMTKLKSWGLEIYGKTPHGGKSYSGLIEYQRGFEIQEYLEKSSEMIESFIILDDNSDMMHLKYRLILCPWDTGLSKELADKAINMLQEHVEVKPIIKWAEEL